MSARVLLNSLPASAALALPIIRSGVRQGLSKRAITEQVRKQGIPITYDRTASPLIDAVRAEETIGRNIRVTKGSDVVPSIDLPESITRLRKRYSFRYQQMGTDVNGNVVVRNINISTDRDDITREELDEIAENTLDDTNNYQPLEKPTTELVFGMQQSLDATR